MEMAGAISSGAMHNIAIGSLDIKASVVTSVEDSTNRNQKQMNYALLEIWRNRRQENNREVSIRIISVSSERTYVSGKHG